MNIQDISDFIDLVKNPAKYERVLQNIKDEQERLNAVIATVGKASELDKLRKEVEKERAELQADFDKLSKERDAYIEREVELLSKKKRDLDEALQNAAKALQDAAEKTAAAKALASSFDGREKQLRQAEESIQVRQKQLDAQISEYSEKIAKLRSVMG